MVSSLYEYLRENAKTVAGANAIDYGEIVKEKNAPEILRYVVNNYKTINVDKKLKAFYKWYSVTPNAKKRIPVEVF